MKTANKILIMALGAIMVVLLISLMLLVGGCSQLADMPSAKEQHAFKKAAFVQYSQMQPTHTPQGKLTKYTPSTIELGNLAWKQGWQKHFDPASDPHWRTSKEWNQDESSRENVSIFQTEIVLTQPSSAGSKNAFLVSNFRIKYGTIRALIKLPNVKGVTSAFWLFGQNGMPEHDVIEHCGEWTNKVAVTHHWGFDYDGENGKKATRNNERENKHFQPTEQYNLYEIELTPYQVTYRINGIVTRIMERGLSSSEQMVLFSVTKSDYCHTSNNSTTASNAQMSIKWIEVYKVK